VSGAAPAATALVVDASVAVKWFVEEPGAEAAAALLGAAALLAPDLIGPECANILWKKFRLGDIPAEQAALAAAELESAAVVQLVPTRSHLGAALRLAIELGHPAYDCLYLTLAADLALPLVTADDRLLRLARSADLAQVVPLAEAPALLAKDG
jgi:predicted nucleic acid-binding protein